MLVLVPKYFFTQGAEDYLFSLLVQYDQSEMGQTWKSLPEKWGERDYLFLTVSTGLFCLVLSLIPITLFLRILGESGSRTWESLTAPVADVVVLTNIFGTRTRYFSINTFGGTLIINSHN